MKKILYGFFAVIAIALVAVGCTKTVNTNPIDNTPQTKIYAYGLTVLPSEWHRDANNNRLFLSGQDLEILRNTGNSTLDDYGILVYFSTDRNRYGDPGTITWDDFTYSSEHRDGVVDFFAYNSVGTLK